MIVPSIACSVILSKSQHMPPLDVSVNIAIMLSAADAIDSVALIQNFHLSQM